MHFKVNDKLTFKKKHACGSDEWEIIKTGAMLKLRCMGCLRVISLLPSDVRKRIKRK